MILPVHKCTVIDGRFVAGNHDDSRLMCNAYLDFFMKDDLLDEMALYPYPDPPAQGNSDSTSDNFMAPSVTYSYDQVPAL